VAGALNHSKKPIPNGIPGKEIHADAEIRPGCSMFKDNFTCISGLFSWHEVLERTQIIMSCGQFGGMSLGDAWMRAKHC
jgi:hypothetical protein